MVLGADGAGIVEQMGQDATRFSPGDRVFGQLWAAPFVEAGTDAEYVAVSEDATLARVPDDLDFVVAAALPTAGMTGLLLVEDLEPLGGQDRVDRRRGRRGRLLRRPVRGGCRRPRYRQRSGRNRPSASAGTVSPKPSIKGARR